MSVDASTRRHPHCTHCGKTGNRTFELRDDAWQDVLSLGVTPDDLQCSCGAPSDRLELVPCNPADGCCSTPSGEAA